MEREDWNRRYATSELVWSAEPNRFLVEETSALPPGRALDVGAGEGRNAVWLAERGWSVVGVDFSDVALEKARALARARGVIVDWVDFDLRDYEPPEAAFDLVIVLYLHLPWSNMAAVLARAASALGPGGTFLLVGHDLTNIDHGWGGPPDRSVLYTADQVATLIGAKLSLIKAGRVERPVETEAGPKIAVDCLVRAQASGRRASEASERSE